MALPPCLVAKTKGTGEAEVQRVVGGTSATIVGLSWGASTLESPAAYDTMAHNRVIRFIDGKLYAVIKNSIRENDGLGGAWTENQAAGFSANNGSSNVAGIYMLDNAGTPTMVVLGVAGGTNTPRTYVSTDGTTWTGTSYATSIGGGTNLGKSITFRNSIFWCTQNDLTDIVQYDLISDSVTFYSVAGVPGRGAEDGDFCVFDNVLYFLAYGATGGNFNYRPSLFRFQGGIWDLVQSIGGGSVVNGSTNSLDERVNHSLYERGGNLYALVCGAPIGTNAGGLYHFKLTPSGGTFVETDITVATIPTSLRSSSDGGSASSDFRVWTIRDNDTDPASPSYYFQILTDDSGGATSYWEHGGDDATLFSDGSSSVNVAWPEMGDGGGERFFTSGGPSIYCTKMEKNTGGGMKLTFHGRGGQTGKTVEAYLNNDEEAPTALATLVASTVTGGTATNTTALISSVDLDGTVYTVIINTAAASLSIGDKATIAAFVAS